VIRVVYIVDSASKVVNCIPYRVSVQYFLLFHAIIQRDFKGQRVFVPPQMKYSPLPNHPNPRNQLGDAEGPALGELPVEKECDWLES